MSASSAGPDAATERGGAGRTSLRGRLFAYIVAGVLLSTALTVGIGYVVVSNRVTVQARRVLARQAELLASVQVAGGAGPHVYAVAPGRRGGVVAAPAHRAARILAKVPSSGAHTGEISLGGTSLLYAERPGPSGRVVLVEPARLAPSETPSFLLSLILAGIGGALLAALLAGSLARRLGRQLAQLGQASRLLAEADEPVHVDLERSAPEELRLLGEAFNHMSQQVVEMRNAQRAFLLSVSHELKTPLTAIKGHAEGLQDGAVDPAAAGDVIVAESARLERLISDLLDLARLDQHAFAVALQPVELERVAEQLIERFAPSARELGISLSIERPEGLATVLADPDRLLQVGSNLVENALRATPQGGSVTILVQPGELTVRDTGPGLAPGDLPRAFERFYLHQKLAAHEQPGSGLGLAIVKELTEAMGGTARVRSNLGEGSQFTVALPSASAVSGVR